MRILSHRNVWLLLVFTASLVLQSACNRDSSGGDVMASVNGRKIYKSEVDKYYANQTAGSDQLTR